MITTVEIFLEVTVLGLAIAAFLTVIGFGITELMLQAEGRQILLAPVVGLAVLMLGFQWISFVAPPVAAAVAVFVATAPLSAVIAWRRRGMLMAAWRDLAGAAVFSGAFYIALMQIVVQRGFVTLASFPADNIFIYAQAAQYLREHPMPSTFHGPDISNPGSFYLISVGPSFPNSVGAIDAAASVLSGRPVYAVFDPLSAVALALTVGVAWYFVRIHFGGSWISAVAAAALIATSQLLYWVIGVGLQQECLALPIMTAGIALFAAALRSGRYRTGALAGILAGALIGLYLPAAVLLVICSIGGVAVSLLRAAQRHRLALVKLTGAALGAGAGASLAALYVLVFEGGLSLWVTVVGARVAAGSISKFPALPYVLGTLPFAHVWELKPMPLGHVERELVWLIVASSGLLVLLMIAGVAMAVLQKHETEAAILIAGLLFVAYEGAVAEYPYGFVKTVGYLVPLTSSFVALGATSPAALLARSGRRAAVLVGWGATAMVLLASINATRDMLHLWLDSRPALTSADLRAERVASIVPVGATVFVDEPGTDYGTLIRAAAIAYFLPDRTVRVFVGGTRLGTFQDQNALPEPCAFDYVVAGEAPQGNFMQVYLDPAIQLGVYKRIGPPCSAI